MKTTEGDISTVRLEKIKVEVAHLIDPYLLGAEARVDILQEVCNAIRISARGYLMGDKHPEKVVKYPSTWWDSFKEQKFPLWLKKRYPVKWTYERFSFVSLYPDFKPSLPSSCIFQSYNFKTKD